MPKSKRAKTSEHKRAIIERLYLAWLANPELRLGQLIVNRCGVDPFYVEDEDLAEACEKP